MSKITYCIPCKNNLRYLKGAIKSIEENSSVEHEIILYIDASTDGTMEWITAWPSAPEYLWNDTGEPLGIAHGYNQCIKEARSDVVCMFHADMYMAKGFDINLLKHLKPKTVVAGTRIEPPLHPKGKEKIVEHFGMYPEDFKKDAFNTYVQNLVLKNKDVTTRGIFAPWIAYKSDLIEIGLHDASLHSYYEDSDIFQRLILNGTNMIQSWDSLVYHFTCRGGQFSEGIEKPTTDQKFIDMRNRSGRFYIRKWQSWIKNDEYQHPVIPKKYNIGFVLTDVISEDFLHFVEPWATNIFVDNMICAERYIAKEQPTTKIDLNTRIYNHGYIEQINNDILLYFSQKDFMSNANENSAIITKLSDIISEGVEDNAEMELGIFKLKTKIVKDISKSLIKL